MVKAMKTILGNSKMQKCIYLLVCGWTMLYFSSCQDAKLAEQLDGAWHTSYTLKDEDGLSYPEEQDVKFTHIKSNIKDGGRFKEKVTMEMQTEEYGMNVSCKFICTISGEWEIIRGDLYMEYDLPSMNVEIKDMDCELPWIVALGFSELEIDHNKIMAEEVRKNAYREMYETYRRSNKENDMGCCFLDLSIEGDTMSYSTSDLGRLEWVRIK